MSHPLRTAIIATCLVLSGSVLADGITGAGSGSTGGTLTDTSKGGTGLQTGTMNGAEAVPSQQPKSGGTGDNAVLNAPREAMPGTKTPSQPSNLNGQNQ